MAEQTGQTLDAKQNRQSQAAPQEARARETGRLTGREHLSAALQAVSAGLSATELPPSTLEELAKTVGNSAMSDLLTLGEPPMETAHYTPPRGALELQAYPAEVAAPQLCAPPALSGLAPLCGQGQSPALLGGEGGAGW